MTDEKKQSKYVIRYNVSLASFISTLPTKVMEARRYGGQTRSGNVSLIKSFIRYKIEAEAHDDYERNVVSYHIFTLFLFVF